VGSAKNHSYRKRVFWTLVLAFGAGTFILISLLMFVETRSRLNLGASRPSWPPTALLPAPAPTPAPARKDELPTFFPPRATDRFSIPLRLAGENIALQQVSDRLSNALREAGYEGKCSYYWVDDQYGPGFAIVTHIEHIQADGKPVLDQRWGFDLPQYGALTLPQLLRAITHADPGRYRLIALVVSRKPLVEKDTPMTQEQVAILNKGPRWLGDSPWKTVLATADFHLVAYVYEFERPSRSDDPLFLASSNLTAENHLRSTGLYDDIERDFSQ
jgi:hypothetical protein